MVTSKERREALKTQTRQSHRERGQRGLKTTLHEQVLRTFPKEVEWGEICSGRDLNEFDIIPFLITEKWFVDLLTFSGKKSEAQRAVGYLSYKLEVPVHRRVGPNNEDWLCLHEAFGRPCAMCEDKFAEFDKAKNDQDKDKISALNPSWRCFYNTYDYNNSELDIHPLEISYKLFEEPLMEEIEMDDDELLCPWDLEGGNTIEFKGREKKIGKVTFIEPHSFGFAKRDPYNEEETLKLTFSFDKYLYLPTYDEVAAAYYGMESSGEIGDPGEGDASEEQATSPRERRRSRPSRRDEEGDDTPPRRSRSRGQDKEEPPDDTEAKTSRRERSSSKTKEDENECPVDGRFGYDCNELDECKDCSDAIFDRCVELQDKLKKQEEAAEKEPEVEKEEKEEKSTTRRRRRTK